MRGDNQCGDDEDATAETGERSNESGCARPEDVDDEIVQKKRPLTRAAFKNKRTLLVFEASCPALHTVCNQIRPHKFDHAGIVVAIR